MKEIQGLVQVVGERENRLIDLPTTVKFSYWWVGGREEGAVRREEKEEGKGRVPGVIGARREKWGEYLRGFKGGKGEGECLRYREKGRENKREGKGVLELNKRRDNTCRGRKRCW